METGRRLVCALAAAAMSAALAVPAVPVLADSNAPQTVVGAGDQLAASASFPDVPENHWAYGAVERLAADGLLKGYPDGKFKGNRPMTRWEIAVLVDRVVRDIEEKMPQVSKADLDAIRSLVNGFRPELDQVKQQLAALQGQVAAVQSQVTAVKTEADATKRESDATAQRLRAGKVGFSFGYRPGTSYTNLSAINTAAVPITNAGNVVGPGGTVPAIANAAGNSTLTFGAGIPDTIPNGQTAHGTNFNFARLQYSGVVDDHFSYAARIRTQIVQENALGNTTLSPSFCNTVSTTNCAFSDLNNGQNTLPINLDYAYLQYQAAGGLGVQVGRFPVFGTNYNSSSPNGFLFGGQSLSGFNVYYFDPSKSLNAAVYYAIPSISSYTFASTVGTPQAVCSAGVLGFSSGTSAPLNGINPRCGGNGNEIAGSISYYNRPSRTSADFEFDTYGQRQFLFWDPSFVNACTVPGSTTPAQAVNATGCAVNRGTIAASNGAFGNFVTGLADFQFIEVDASQEFGPRNRPTLRLDLNWLHRLGTDPFTVDATGAPQPWYRPDAYGVGLTYASKGNIYGAPPNATNPATGTRNSNVAQVYFQQLGLNSTGGIAGITQGASSPATGLGFTNLNGMQVLGATYQYWFTDNFRLGIYGIHINETPNTLIPVGTFFGPNTCRGCAINGFNTNYLYLDSWFYFN